MQVDNVAPLLSWSRVNRIGTSLSHMGPCVQRYALPIVHVAYHTAPCTAVPRTAAPSTKDTPDKRRTALLPSKSDNSVKNNYSD